jgi:hypothetical protein
MKKRYNYYTSSATTFEDKSKIIYARSSWCHKGIPDTHCRLQACTSSRSV